jgi:hypothetical protein
MESKRDRVSQAGVVDNRDGAPQSDSDFSTRLGEEGAGSASSERLLLELELLSDMSPSVSPPTGSPDHPTSDTRSERMSSVSEQEPLNPRDPLYYAPRWLRERSASQREGSSEPAPFSPASFDTQLESAVSNALRHPLDPEVMNEPGPESKKALWTVAARFAAAIGVAALVALFFMVAVPGSRQSDGDQVQAQPQAQGQEQPSTLAGVAQSIKSALSPSTEAAQKPAINEFQALLAATPPSAPAQSEPSGQLLQQFMQWREKPDQAAPQRASP